MKILSNPKGNAQEYGRWAVNPYKGCPHGCLYCYLKKGAWAKGLGGGVPVLKEHIVSEEHAYHVAMAEILEHREEIIRDGGLFMTFTSDPLIKENRDLMLSIANDAIQIDIPVTMLTKDVTFFDLDPEEWKSLGLDDRENWRRNLFFYHSGSGKLNFIPNPHFNSSIKQHLTFGFTLTGHDELEPNASPNKDRIKAIRCLTDRNFYTWASIEPVITFDSSFEMIQQALDAGCRHFKVGLMTNNTRVCRNGFSYGGHDFAPYKMDECVEFVEYVMALTEGKATVYWKQSFVDFLEVSKKDPQPVRGMTAREFLSGWSHSVGSQWSMFNHQKA